MLFWKLLLICIVCKVSPFSMIKMIRFLRGKSFTMTSLYCHRTAEILLLQENRMLFRALYHMFFEKKTRKSYVEILRGEERNLVDNVDNLSEKCQIFKKTL